MSQVVEAEICEVEFAQGLKGEHCPVCNGTQIEGGSYEHEGCYVYREGWCNDCDAKWFATYMINKVVVRTAGS